MLFPLTRFTHFLLWGFDTLYFETALPRAQKTGLQISMLTSLILQRKPVDIPTAGISNSAAKVDMSIYLVLHSLTMNHSYFHTRLGRG